MTNSGYTGDQLGHGTAVTGALAAATNNWAGVAGVTWQNPVMPLVAIDSAGYASYSNIAAAIQYAVDHGAKVINLSLGGYTSSAVLQGAVDYAWNHGALVVASAMNEGSQQPSYPAACNHAVAVSATNEGDSRASFSNFGSWITLSAPGNNILTTNSGGGYGYWYGTSLAAPLVSGVAALAFAVNPGLGAQGVLTALERGADDLGQPGFDVNFGWGRLNAYRTVMAALGGAPAPAPKPVASPTPAPAPAPTPAPAVPPPSSTANSILINAGGSGLTDPLGHKWGADTGFSGGLTWVSSGLVANTPMPQLYGTCRYGEFTYNLPVPNGNYKVVLKFAEVSQGGPGQRVFNVAINGVPVLSNFDIFARTGGQNIALDESFPVTVSNGRILIQFTNGWANSPMVNAIEVMPAGTPTF